MPLETTVTVNPRYKAEDKAQIIALEAAKKKGAFTTDHGNAMECVRNSNGLYMLQVEEPAPTVGGPRLLEDMSSEELKIMMLQSGVTPQKQMKKSEVIKAIRIAMDAVTIEDDEKVAE